MNNLISAVRRKKKVTQRELAKALSVSPSYLCKIENGVQLPNERFMVHCAEILETPRKDLFPENSGKKRKLSVSKIVSSGLWSARTDRGIKQVDLAKQLGCSPSYLSKIEQGKIIPKSGFKKKCARILKVKEAELFPS